MGKRRIGLLTGGGDAPGLNGIIEAAGRVLLRHGVELVGIEDGFEGVFEERHRLVTLSDLEGIHQSAGTLLGTSNRSGTKGREKEFVEKISKLSLDGLLVAGGDGTFAALREVSTAIPGSVKMVGVPKTIDNDLSGTEVTFGFDTACSVIAESVNALRVSAEAHRRIMVVEVMGRTAGWLALGGGMASYAEVILVPERPFDRQKLLEFITQQQRSRRGLVIVVAEGACASGEDPTVAFHVAGSPESARLGGIGQKLARWIEAETGWESRAVVLGHLQRSRHPTTTDCFLTLSMGVEAARMILEEKWGHAAVYRNGHVVRAPITDLMGPPRLITDEHRWVKLSQALGIFI
ncbi:ATP-dependent 6-phosphofructokinase [bacterium]|nr:ATP-dependent 6-phosphofructokinase [bacterium]